MSDVDHHFIKFNSTHIAEARIVFYGIISLEISLYLILFIFQPFVCYAFLKTGVMHRNFRIQACFIILYYTMQSVCRFILVYYELNDVPISSDDNLLFWVETIRDAVHCYFCSIPGSFAFERFVATHYWSWYEKSSLSTLWVFIIVELSNTIPAFMGSYLIFTERVDNTFVFIVFGILLVIGLVVFVRTYLLNLQTLKQLAQGATINFYSVSRTFQVQENVEIMTYMSKLALPTVMAGTIPVTGLAVNLFGPPEWRFVRNVGYAVFDLGIPITAGTCMVFAIIGNARIHNEFRKIYPMSLLYAYLGVRVGNKERVTPCSAETDTHFSQLTKAWDQQLEAV